MMVNKPNLHEPICMSCGHIGERPPPPPRWSALRPQPWPMDAAALLDQIAARATDLALTGPAIAALRVR